MRSFCTVRISSMMRSKIRFTASGGERAVVVAGDVREDLVLAPGLVDRHVQRALDLARSSPPRACAR